MSEGFIIGGMVAVVVAFVIAGITIARYVVSRFDKNEQS